MPSSIKENTHLLSQEIKRNLQQSDVTRAFTAFYDTMRHSEHFNHFFESDAQMDALILKQAKNFYDSLNMDDATFKKNYFTLGYRHAKMQLPIEDMFAGLMMIRDNLLKHVQLPESYLYLLIERMENEIAHGYFIYQAQDLKSQIDLSLRNIKDTIAKKRRKIVSRPLLWLKKLLSQIEISHKINLPHLSNSHYCSLTPLLDKLIISSDLLQLLHTTHQDQHALAGSFSYFIDNENYKLAGFILAKLSSISFSLSNQISYAISQELISDLQADGLTGLFLRYSLKEQFKTQSLKAKQEDWKLGLILRDIDHFKKINDTYGHQAGDLVLKEVGKCLKKLKREHDLAYRYGGEEFLILVTHLEKNTLTTIAERIRQAIKSLQITWKGQSIPLTASLGGYYLKTSKRLKKAIEVADKNLYKAKNRGRNQVICTSS